MKKLDNNQFSIVRGQIDDLVASGYPEFLLHDEISNKYWEDLFSSFPEFQIVYQDGNEVIGVGNTIPICYLQQDVDLKISGWDWALEKGFLDKIKGNSVNVLIGLSVVVSKKYRGLNLSKTILEDFKQLAKNYGISKVLIPVRPVLKHKYPLSTFDDYINFTSNGKSIDPWIRIHQEIGGRSISVCKKSMTIHGNIEDWENWTKLKFPISGKYHIEGGLIPVELDLEKNFGSYIEPNLWIEH